MEGSKSSRLPKPSGIKSSQMKAKPLMENKLNRLQPNPGPTSSKSTRFTRRSKSVADLRTLVDKRTLSKVGNIQSSQQIIIKNTQKRKVEKSGDEVKSKMFKQAKIPDWDYKSRFMQLREKHTLLNEEYKKQSNKLLEFEDVESKYEEIQRQHKLLENEYVTISNINLGLNKENQQLQMKISELKANLDSLTKNHEELKQKYEILATEGKINIEKIEKISNENQSLSENLDKKIGKCVDLSDQVDFLKKEVQQGEILRRKLHNTVQDLKGNIRVYCRVRPVNFKEEDRLQCVINFIDDKSIEIRKSRESVSTISGKPTDMKVEFTLDRVFEPKSTQSEIFEDLSELVQSALDGYDICVFAYGQTGSGKTYTMQGGETSCEAGLIPRTIDLLFNSINNLRRLGWAYEIKASFLEIYNENVRDLLNPNLTQNLEIRYNEGKGTTVTNLTIQLITSAYDLKKWMTIAHRNRAVAATDFNEHSSRSHAVTKIYLQGVNKEVDTIYTGSVNLVDLAGSESAKTSANERLTETKNINKSLSTLGSVMLALYNKEKHIPYRNSKLTYLLQSSLGGNSKTLMVVNIAPFEDCYTESINSLRFAAKVKEVKISAKRNKSKVI